MKPVISKLNLATVIGRPKVERHLNHEDERQPKNGLLQNTAHHGPPKGHHKIKPEQNNHEIQVVVAVAKKQGRQ